MVSLLKLCYLCILYHTSFYLKNQVLQILNDVLNHFFCFYRAHDRVITGDTADNPFNFHRIQRRSDRHRHPYCGFYDKQISRLFHRNDDILKKCRIPVCRLCCGITREQTMAFGDGGNDTDMLAYAGIGVAMGNATAEPKAAADYITDDVDHDGVRNALLHFGVLRD